MAIALFILGEKGFEVLKTSIDYNVKMIHYVVIGKDRNVQNDFALESEELVKSKNIKYSFIKPIKNALESTKYVFAIGWRNLIHINRNQQLIVFHDSLLPKYRGFNPLVTALINGDQEIGVTALFGVEEYDRGPIIGQRKTSVKYPLKIQEAISTISRLYSELMLDVLIKIKDDALHEGEIQNEKLATYSLWRNDDDYYIDWTQSAIFIERFVNAVGYPYSGARTTCEGQMVIIDNVKAKPDVEIINRNVGKVIFKTNTTITVVCGFGLLEIPIDSLPESLKNKFRLKFT